MQAVKLADEIYDNTQDRNSSIAMLRAACQLCPACPLTRQGRLCSFCIVLQHGHHVRGWTPRHIVAALSVYTAPGSWSWEVFYIDSYEDRTMLYSQIMPAIYSSNVKDLLWVGVQPYTLRYEYMLRRHGITMTSLEVRLFSAAWHSKCHSGSTWADQACSQDSARTIAWAA